MEKRYGAPAAAAASLAPFTAMRGRRSPLSRGYGIGRAADGMSRMAKFIIEPHFRLQGWIAEEKGYFRDEALGYEFRELLRSTGGQRPDKGGARLGAFQSFEAGRSADVSCACHWTVNVAASSGHGRLYAD